MIKFFRKIRFNLLKKGNSTNYLKYAIGEIFLVMVGILLALQINNWNENRKQQNEFVNILKTIQKDLKTDTLVANIIIDYYKEIEENSLKIIKNEITKENFKDHPNSYSLVSRYRPFNIQTKGFEMVKNFSNNNEIQSDTLFVNISQFYTAFLPIIDDSNNFVKKEVFNNIDAYKKYNWYIDWTQGNITPEIITYFTESEEYKKQVASHNLLAGKNHLLFITSYRDNAIKVIDLIENQLVKI